METAVEKKEANVFYGQPQDILPILIQQLLLIYCFKK